MARITISYRRDDSDVITGRIFDRLTAHFGRETVFRDIDSIPLGVDFRKHVDSVIEGTDLMVAVVGPKWIGARAGQSRLDNAADPVRVEIDAALRKGVPLIPVLVLRAQMPRADQLPSSLEDFAYRNAARIDAGQDFDTHMARLIRAIDNVLEEKTKSAAAQGGLSFAAEAVSTPSSSPSEQEEQRHFAEQLRREEEARQLQVEEDRQREFTEARRRDQEERQEAERLRLAEEVRQASERREREEKERLEAAVRQAAEQQERAEQERIETAARRAAEQRDREEKERQERAARQAVEQREREEKERLEEAERQEGERREHEEKERLELAARSAVEQREREEAQAVEPPVPPATPAAVSMPSSQPGMRRKALLGLGAAALAIVIVLVIIVATRPNPAPPLPAPAPAAPPQAQNDPPVSTFIKPGQLWSISFSDKDHHRYNATLAVSQSLGFNSFSGKVDVAFKESDGTDKVVREDALVTINEPKVTISCSNATVIKGTGSYAADYFDFAIKSNTEAEGTSLDDKEFVSGATMRRN